MLLWSCIFVATSSVFMHSAVHVPKTLLLKVVHVLIMTNEIIKMHVKVQVKVNG